MHKLCIWLLEAKAQESVGSQLHPAFLHGDYSRKEVQKVDKQVPQETYASLHFSK